MSVTPITDVPRLPPRARDAHKGSFGKVLVLAGSDGMSGAAVLCGTAALRGGAGLVQLGVPVPIAHLVAAQQPCYMVQGVLWDALPRVLEMARSADVVVAGPGLGRSAEVRALVQALCAEGEIPLVLDADALNVLGAWPVCLRDRAAATVLTPHPAEFARLTGSDTATVQAGRLERAAEFAAKQGGVVVLKGAGTVVTDGARAYVNTTGNPGMATGGSGDVLAGLLGALLAQKMPAFEAAVLGAWLHGLAGDLARDRVGEVSLIATDLLDLLPEAFRRLGG
jgi:NAD(P)H-hydrate epimerase